MTIIKRVPVGDVDVDHGLWYVTRAIAVWLSPRRTRASTAQISHMATFR